MYYFVDTIYIYCVNLALDSDIFLPYMKNKSLDFYKCLIICNKYIHIMINIVKSLLKIGFTSIL